MNEQARADADALLRKAAARLRSKSLFGAPGDSLSVRVPGREELLLARPDDDAVRLVGFGARDVGAAELHGSLYRARADAGALLFGTTPWSAALCSIGVAVPILFDEQARHIGKMEDPVGAGQGEQLLAALRRGGNVALYGQERICVGTTPDRVVFNADLFEKCVKTYLIAHASGASIRQVPPWARYMTGRRLAAAQRRAAASYASGRVPEGMDAY